MENPPGSGLVSVLSTRNLDLQGSRAFRGVHSVSLRANHNLRDEKPAALRLIALKWVSDSVTRAVRPYFRIRSGCTKIVQNQVDGAVSKPPISYPRPQLTLRRGFSSLTLLLATRFLLRGNT
jgi:hypothetical protein